MSTSPWNGEVTTSYFFAETTKHYNAHSFVEVVKKINTRVEPSDPQTPIHGFSVYWGLNFLYE
jgi:hypothetical protein